MENKSKVRIKERIARSNENVKNGLPPDPWVVEFRKKNNITKQVWKNKQPKKEIKKRTANEGSFKPGHTLIPKLTTEEKELSLKNKRQREKLWYINNKEKQNKKLRLRRKTDPEFRIKCNLRKRLSFLLRLSFTTKTEQTMSLLGCGMKFFVKYLENKFTKGMSFENYGIWHIDHIRPCKSFNLSNEEDRKLCFHYSNLQPLWGIDNILKSDKY